MSGENFKKLKTKINLSVQAVTRKENKSNFLTFSELSNITGGSTMERSLAGKNQINYLKNCIKLRRRPLLDKLSDFRRGNPGHNFKEFCVSSTQLKMNVKIVAKSKSEAAKLVGLVLVHKGVVRSLGDDSYILGVIEKNDPNDVAQKFNVWKALDKIYVESVYTREVKCLFFIHTCI